MLVDFLAYRKWAINLVMGVANIQNNHTMCLHRQFEYHKEADLTFLIGWSDIVPIDFYQYRNVLVLHPSPLPKYRGGSPIQHQIMAGETISAVTLFKLDARYPEIDSGPIYAQESYSLVGELQHVFDNIVDVGEKLVADAIEEYANTGKLFLSFQDDSLATTFKRRTPDQSEITTQEILSSTAEQLYNKIRALQDPYPNAFIRCSDGSRLYITQAHL